MASLLPDAFVLMKLIKPLYDSINARTHTAPRFSSTVLHAGCILVGFGEWLMERESVGQLISEVREGARADTDATIEMVMAGETGSPVPPVKVR